MQRRLLLAGASAAALGVPGGLPILAPPPDPFSDGAIGLTYLGDSIIAGSTTDAANGIAAGNPTSLITGNGCRAYLYDWLRGPGEVAGLTLFGTRWSGSRGLHHEGYPGETIAQLTARVRDGLLVGREPQYLVLLAGANDFGDAYLRAWDQAVADTSTLLDLVLAAAPWIRVVLCEQILMSGAVSHDRTKSSRQQQAYNAALPGLVASKAGRVVVARTSVIGQDMLDPSGVHPTDVGYRWLAWAVYQALAPWLGHDLGAGAGRWMTNIPVPPGSPRPTWLLP